ncbi:MAG: DNA replication and repair protein RecF [Gammaproteobacteria bacterium]
MQFEFLAIANLRCLELTEFTPATGVNLVCGGNGSGKTSLLEGFAVASLGRSFLSNTVTDIVRTGSDGLAVRARVRDPAQGRAFAVQVRKLRGETQIRLDGETVQAASALARAIPTLVMNSKAADMLTENPANRRALIDRTMFHVEQGYVDSWKGYRQALRQRNELLRQGAQPRDVAYWDEQLVELGTRIDDRRRAVVAAMERALAASSLNAVLGELSIRYNPGWDRERGLLAQLRAGWERDCQAGYTTAGIHRADLSIRCAGRGVARRISRGQGKLLVATLYVGLGRFIADETGRVPVFLVDDLHAELDDNMCRQAVDIITALGGQSIFTAIRPSDLPAVTERTADVFHVEHHHRASPA